MTLFRFTVRSAETNPAFDASSFVLPFDGRLEADEFAASFLQKFGVYGPFDPACPIELFVNPVAFRTSRRAGAAGTNAQ